MGQKRFHNPHHAAYTHVGGYSSIDMKTSNNYILIILVTFWSCGTNTTRDRQIFDEFLLLNYKAYNESVDKNIIATLDDYEPGDTLSVDMTLRLSIDKDSTDAIPTGATLTILDIRTNDIKVRSVNKKGTTVEGYLGKDFMTEYLFPDNKHRRLDFFKDLGRIKRKGTDEILKKYKIDEEEFIQIIGREFKKTTGENGINL